MHFGIWLGLIGAKGEIAAKGYRRIPLNARFRLTLDQHGTPAFVNVESVRWPIAEEAWEPVFGLGFFKDETGGEPFRIRPFDSSGALEPVALTSCESVGIDCGSFVVEVDQFTD
jgi:hypothetical protein